MTLLTCCRIVGFHPSPGGRDIGWIKRHSAEADAPGQASRTTPSSAIRDLIASGEAGSRHAPSRARPTSRSNLVSPELTARGGRALSLARVLEVRQGDGTYVSSLEPGELLEPTLSATHLLRGRTVLELFEVRRMLEPEAAAMAALHADSE